MPVEAWVLARGRDLLAPALALDEEGSVQLRPAGEGWWLLSLTTSAMEQVADLLTGHDWLAVTSAGPESGFLYLAGGDGMRRYVFGDEDELRLAQVPVEAQAAHALPLHAWARGRTPRSPTPRGERSLWQRAGGARETASVLWKRLGLIDRASEPWRDLAGCLEIFPERAGWFGFRNLQRVPPSLIVGRGEDYYGVWDWAQPDREPQQRYPLTVEGLLAAKRDHYQRAMVPILHESVFAGERLWTRIDNTEYPIVIGRNHENRMFIILGLPVPKTWLATLPGRDWVMESTLHDAGLPAKDFREEWPIRDMADVRRLAKIHLARLNPQPWRDVPDDVPRRLPDTLSWIRRQAGISN
jgi:hypothetical protein